MTGGGWRDYADLVAEFEVDPAEGVAIWSTPADPNETEWGHSVWAGTDAFAWLDRKCPVQSASWAYGRNRLQESVQTSTATVTVIDDDGWASERFGSTRPLRVARRVRLSIGTQVMWTGRVDAVEQRFEPGLAGSVATIVARDVLGDLAAVNPPQTAVPSESAEARMVRIFDMAGVPYRATSTWTWGIGPTRTVIAGTLAQNLLTEAQLTAASFQAVVYATPEGEVTVARAWPAALPDDSWTVTNGPPGSLWSLCPSALAVSGPAVEDVVNLVSVAAVGGTEYVSDDEASIGRYGTRAWSRHDLIYSGSGATLAGSIVSKLRGPRRYYAATFDLPAAFPSGPWAGAFLNLLGALVDQYRDHAAARLGFDWTVTPDWALSYLSGLVVAGMRFTVTPDAFRFDIATDNPRID